MTSPFYTCGILPPITFRISSIAANSFYYHNPYRTDLHDANGFRIAGVSQAVHLMVNPKYLYALDPIHVWFTTLNSGTGFWEKKVLFEPIEPMVGGKKLAWLFVTGFMSESMVAVQVKL
ncbi:hypothetical protein PITC_079080 [Penicillium italicum]|uniref:Uncharacterized protein n=1 Tax=Penicillium italicum TaxID=40296 RepID=A0A0A2KC99_PENIT|nr:hypothetical protein PITC_079080 [Penicillium italicum]